MIRRYEDLKAVDKEWWIKRDETRDETKEPLVVEDEWVKIKSYDSRRLETRDRWGNLTPGSQWGYLDQVLKLHGYRAGALGNHCVESRKPSNGTRTDWQ